MFLHFTLLNRANPDTKLIKSDYSNDLFKYNCSHLSIYCHMLYILLYDIINTVVDI